MHQHTFVPTLLCSLFLCMVSVHGSAQSTINATQKVNTMDTLGVEAKLIRIALTRPSYDVTYHQVRNARHALSIARNSWLNLLSITLDYNEFDLSHKTSATNTAYVYPKYFFGITIPIGYIFSRGSEIKTAKDNQLIAQDNRLEAERTIIADVKTKYRTYLDYQSILAVQNIVVNDEQAAFLQIEKNFRDGKASITDYNNASKGFNSTVLQQLQYKLLADQTKVDLEHILGMALEDALKQ
jgi:outer membrane protein TolC